jgi:hypothetical protein
MSRQFRLQRKVKSPAIVAGGFDTVDLPRGYDYEAVFFRIEASLNVTVNTTSVRAEAPVQLVPRVELIADGKNTVFSAPFWAISLGSFARPLPESGARATTPPSAATVATYAVEAIGAIDLATVDGLRPKDSNFRSYGLSLLQTRLTFGLASDPFVLGAGAVAFSGSPVVDVFTAELVEDMVAPGKFATDPVAIRKVSFQEQAFAASNANAEIRLPAGNLIRSTLTRTEGGTTAGEPSLQINNRQLLNGVDVRINLTGKQLRAKNNADYGQLTSGYYVADVLARGQSAVALSELWDVSAAAEPKEILDITGGASVKAQIVTTEYIPLAAL